MMRQPVVEQGGAMPAANAPEGGSSPVDITLPRDQLQPGEQLNGDGLVEPGESMRQVSAGGNLIFDPGVDRFLEGGMFADNGWATSIASSSTQLSYAIYRIPLSGSDPGTIGVDANCADAAGYYFAIADYSAMTWRWFGPYTQNYVNLHAPEVADDPAALTSPLGNVFVCVAAAADSFVDVVGVSVSKADPADTEPPTVPSAPVLTPVKDGLLVEWESVEDAQLAGYKLYYSNSLFTDADSTGVKVLGTLAIQTSMVLSGLSHRTFVRIAAVDLSGNESAVSGSASNVPLPGPAPELPVNVATPSAVLNEPVLVTSGGFDLYDIDRDADGDYEFTDRTTATHQLYTNSVGVSRSRFRARSADGTAVAFGGGSAFVVGFDKFNLAPAADLELSTAIGDQLADVSFSATGSDDSDGVIVSYEYDFNGDGFYDLATEDAAVDYQYPLPGIYRARVRVTDNDGARSTASADIRVNDAFDTPHYWPMAGGNPRRNGRSQLNGAPTNHFKWSFDMPSLVRSSPAVAEDGTIYVGCDDNNLYAIRPGGSLKWFYPTGGNVSSSPAIADDGTIYVGSWDKKLHAVQPNGDEEWTFTTGAVILSSPVIGPDGTIYIGSNDGRLYAVTAEGDMVWSFLASNWIVSSPALAVDGSIYFGCRDGYLYALDSDGNLKWKFKCDDAVDCTPAVGSDGTVYVGSWDRFIYALSPEGAEIWSYQLGANIDASPAIAADGTVYAASRNNKLYAFRPDGGFKWEFSTGDGIASSPAIGKDGTIYFGSADNYLYALRPDGSLRWSYETGGDVESSPAIGPDGTVFVGSLDFELYAIGP